MATIRLSHANLRLEFEGRKGGSAPGGIMGTLVPHTWTKRSLVVSEDLMQLQTRTMG